MVPCCILITIGWKSIPTILTVAMAGIVIGMLFFHISILSVTLTVQLEPTQI
jgi:hypothetical protein